MNRVHCPNNLLEPYNHKFIIPVEWDNIFEAGFSHSIPTKQAVTKLRCECGEETDR